MASNDRVLVSKHTMEEAITKYENARSTLQDAFAKLDSAKEHLDNCYKGPAYMGLCLKWLEINANVRSADDAIEETMTGLRNTVAQMVDAEESNKNKINNLEVGKDVPVYKEKM